jgi:hypothetical protein
LALLALRKCGCALKGAAVTVEAWWAASLMDAATLPKPAHVALSGILEREPGGVLGEHVLSHGKDDQLLCV